MNIKKVLLYFTFVSSFFISCSLTRNQENDDFLFFLAFYTLLNQPPVCSETILDPLFSDQWHIQNIGQSSGTNGEDGKVFGVWQQNNWGYGSKIAIVDDGIDVDHPDLKDNILFHLNFEYTTSSSNLSLAYTFAIHGTSVAGVSAGRCNDLGVRGVAPLANLFGYNLLVMPNSSNTADAMVRNLQETSISNNSWGATDGTGNLDASLADTLWKNSIIEGIQNGRSKKGIVYTWAAGNGRGDTDEDPTTGTPYDDSNYDGQANFYGVMAICAVTNKGKQAWYSERGANLWICAPSNGGSLGITTTDIRGSYGYSPDNGYFNSDYTNDFGGTSSATPYISGVVALMLSANPNLTYRDIRYILAKTARKVDPTDPDWKVNAGGFHINHKYGFGVVDAEKAVNLAKTFSSLGGYDDLKIYSSSSTSGNTINISGSGISKIEFVEVNVTFSTADFGSANINLTSPASTVAKLVETHNCPSGCDSYTSKSWRFGVARFLDENPNGTFTLSYSGITLINWNIKIYGR